MMAPLVRKDITEIRLERASSHFLFSPLLSSLLFSSPFLPSSLLSSQFLSSPHLFSSVRMAGCKQATWGRVQKLNYHPQTNFLLLSLSLVLIVFCVIAFKMICFHWGKGTRQSWSEEHLLHLPYRTSKAPLRALSNNMCFKQTNKQMTGKSVRKK